MDRDDPAVDPLHATTRRSLLAATATATVGSSAVAGCLGRGQGDDTIVMTGDSDFADAMTDGDPSIQEALWDAGLDEAITVEVRPGVADSAQQMRAAQSTLQAGRGRPDVIRMDCGWTIPFILREQAAELGDHLAQDVLDRIESSYLESALETARHPDTGDLYGVPLFVDFGTMLYRKDLVESAGFDTGDWVTDPPSWQTFSEVVAETRDDADVEYGFTTQAEAYEGLACCSFNELMTTWGGSYFGGTENLFTAGDREITVDEEPVLDSIRMVRSFLEGSDGEYALDGYHQICPSSIIQWSEEESLGPFSDGEAVAHRNWPFSIEETGGEDGFGEDLGVTPMPHAVAPDEAAYPGTGGPAAALGGWHLTLNPNSENVDQAVQVLEAFTEEDVMLTIFEALGYLPPNLALVREADADEIGPVARYTEQIQIAGEHAISRPVTDLWPEQSGVITREVHAAFRGVKSPENAMTDLADRLRQSESVVADSVEVGRGD